MGFTAESLASVAYSLGILPKQASAVLFYLHKIELIKRDQLGSGVCALFYRVKVTI